MFKSIGTIKYLNREGNLGVCLLIDQGIVDFYRSLIPKYIWYQRQMFPPHITVVRIFKEKILDLKYWENHKKRKITFYYDGIIHMSKTYLWIDAFSKELEEIRTELNLSNYSQDPDLKGFNRKFHITLGNFK